jgi:subtilisin family serine protease
MSPAAVRELESDPNVRFIEQDRFVQLAVNGNPSNGGDASLLAQTTPWGITYVGGAGNGTGKVAWIIDTGIDLAHKDLTVDKTRSKTFARGTKNANDGNGHGTHVAGIVAAKNNSIGTVGVAAGASVVAVRVLNSTGSGYYSDIIAGVNYVASKAAAGDVANMSLGGGYSAALNDAVIALAEKGVYVAVAAGNDGADAQYYSPASADHASIYTVSAIASWGCMPSWSNYGADVEFAAPGVNVLSLWRNNGTRTLSGTSMAAPHVAGILLLNNGVVNSSAEACLDPDGVNDPIASR